MAWPGFVAWVSSPDGTGTLGKQTQPPGFVWIWSQESPHLQRLGSFRNGAWSRRETTSEVTLLPSPLSVLELPRKELLTVAPTSNAGIECRPLLVLMLDPIDHDVTDLQLAVAIFFEARRDVVTFLSIDMVSQPMRPWATESRGRAGQEKRAVAGTSRAWSWCAVLVATLLWCLLSKIFDIGRLIAVCFYVKYF